MSEIPNPISPPKPNNRKQEIDWKQQVELFENLNEDHEAYRFSKKTFYENDTAGVYNDNEN